MTSVLKRLTGLFVKNPIGQLRRLVGDPTTQGSLVVIPAHMSLHSEDGMRWLSLGDLITIVQQDESWFQVLHEQGLFWVSQRYVTSNEEYEYFDF